MPPTPEELERKFTEMWSLLHTLQTDITTRPDYGTDIKQLYQVIYGPTGYQVQIATLKERLANMQWWFRFLAGGLLGLGAEAMSRFLG